VIQSSSIGWNLEYPAWLPRRKVPTPALRFRVEQPQSYLSPEKRAFERAQLGLLGMVLGEQAGGWFLTKRIEATNVASVHVVGELNHRQAVLLDAFSRSCIGWALQRSLEAGLVLEALRMTLRQRRPRPGLVHHSDRGVQYAAQDYRAQLQQHGIRISMSRRGMFTTMPRRNLFVGKTLEHAGKDLLFPLREWPGSSVLLGSDPVLRAACNCSWSNHTLPAITSRIACASNAAESCFRKTPEIPDRINSAATAASTPAATTRTCP